LQAIAGTSAVTDITLQGSATYIAGSDNEMGPATLVALTNQYSLVTLNLTGGQRQEIRNGISGASVGADGTALDMGSHNCFVDASWFYPAFTLEALATDPTLAVTLVGQETDSGESVYHLVFSRVVSRSSPSTVALIQSISATDPYLDAASLLPSTLAFNQHPAGNTFVNIPVEIRFGSYKAVNGVQVPMHIQRYLEYSLQLDLTLTNATVNSGVSPNLFALPSNLIGGAQ